jgi:hypothetical protein
MGDPKGDAELATPRSQGKHCRVAQEMTQCAKGKYGEKKQKRYARGVAREAFVIQNTGVASR